MHTLTDRPMPERKEQDGLDEIAVAFAEVRPRLLAIATRILGSTSDADDIVQDAWIRWQLCDRSVVANATAFLVTTTTRLAINSVQSARARRETAVGTWTPEPADREQDVTAGLEREEAIERAVDLLVQRLTPTERAAYVLRRGFGYRYPRIADMLGISTSNARQLVSRATKHLIEERALPVAHGECRRLAQAVTTAARHGDLSLLERALLHAGRPTDALLAA